ncbi:unnamed protein product, partial [Symbiodinium microadriaticum]
MALAAATAVCRDDAADPRLLGRQSLGGKKQYEEKFRLEELAAEGRRSRGSEKVEAVVQPGWAKLLQNVKVCSKSAQLEEPLVGWVTLSKGVANVMARYRGNTRTGPPLESVGAMPGPSPAPNCTSADRRAEVATVAAQAIEAPAPDPETTEETFHLLLSVGTWLSVPSAIYTEGDLQNGAEERKAEVPFRHLPSVATWLVPIKQGEQAENEMLRPSVPSVDAWLQRRPPSSTSSRRDTQGNLQ